MVVRINLTPRSYIDIVNTCPNDECDFDIETKGNFCYQCGENIQPVNFPRTGSVGWEQFLNALPDEDYNRYCDTLHSPEYLDSEEEEILLPDGGGSYLDTGGDYNTFAELVKMADEHEREFRRKNDELVARLETFFNYNVIIETGVASFWS